MCYAADVIKLCVIVLCIIIINTVKEKLLYEKTSLELSQMILKLQKHNFFVNKKHSELAANSCLNSRHLEK